MTPRVRASLVLLALSGCEGLIVLGEPPPVEPPPEPLPTVEPVRVRYTCDAPSSRGTSQPGVRRLNIEELSSTLRVVLGASLFDDPSIADAVQSLPSDTVRVAPSDFGAAHPQDYAAVLRTAAENALTLLSNDAAARERVFGTCGVGANPDEACARAFIERFGQSVYRRPLTDDERAFNLETWTLAGRGKVGLEAVLFVLLQAPPLAFHIETGAGNEGARTRLTDFEVASRIAYLTTGAPPDDALLSAAAAGQLQTKEETRAQTERLLDGASGAHERMRAFFNYYADLNAVPDADPALGEPLGITTDGLGEEFRTEAFDYFDALFWSQRASYAEFMRSTASFPSTPRLTAVFQGSTHAGFLHRPAILTSMGDRTSPILRGAHVRVKYLCVAMPPPNNALVESVAASLGDIENQSNRAKTEQLTASASCSGCHRLINPLGYAFEGFDQLARARTEEKVPGLGTFAIDTRVVDPRIDDLDSDGLELADSAALSEAIGHSVAGPACFVQRAFEFTRARTLSDADRCALSEAEAAIRTGSMRDAVVALISNDDLFWRAAP